MLRGVLVLALVGFAGAPLGWVVSDHFESRNEFCVACHLEPERRLHARKMHEFEAEPAVNLASLHLAAEADFRCVDCHAGASFVNKLRVKMLAARDAVRYFAGAFGEPTHMLYPLWDEDCVQCHPGYAPRRGDDFHAFEAHNVSDFAYACVSCHQAHPVGAPAALDLLDQQVVMPVCRNCHEEF